MTAQLTLPACVLPGCGTPVSEWGDACRACVTAFGDMLQPAGERMDEAEIYARDQQTASAYATQNRNKFGAK